MSSKYKDDFSDDFSDSEEEDFKPKPKPTKKTQHKRPLQKVINLGQAGGGPPKKKPTKRPVSAGAIKQQQQKPKRSAVDYWSESMQRGGVGLTTANAASSMSGLSKKQTKEMSYSSTSHYLRQLVGTEKPKRSVLESPGRTTLGRPAYKSPEEYYDDILELKKQIAVFQNDNSTMKSKVRRLEEDNLKKEREIEQLLDPSKSDELRRTLADRKPDAGAVIHSLKQKILKLEHQLKDREAAYARIQSDLKKTKVEEMKLQVDTFYKEIVRLNNLKVVDGLPSRRQKEEMLAPRENAVKMKALQETILRMNEKNLRLTTENKTLKLDLEKVLEDSAKARDVQKDYEDMSKRQLLSSIAKLEKKLDKADADSMSILSEIDQRQGNVQGKITLEGSVAQRLDQLDQRETELLAEVEKQRSMIKKLKDDRVHYRKKAEDKEKEIKTLKKDIDELQAELDSLYEKDRPVITPRAMSSVARRRSPSIAASTQSQPRKPGRTSPQTRSRSPSVSSDAGIRREERERYRRIEQFRQDTAAKHIQRNWRNHRQRKDDQDETAEFLQSALRGHMSRKQQINAYKNRPPSRGASVYEDEDDSVSVSESITESELDSASELIQANIRGHFARKEQLKRRSSSRSPTLSRSSHGQHRLNSAGEEEEEDDKLSSSMSRGSHRPSARGVRSVAKKPPVSPRKSSQAAASDDDSDDDDDLIVTSSSRGRIF